MWKRGVALALLVGSALIVWFARDDDRRSTALPGVGFLPAAHRPAEHRDDGALPGWFTRAGASARQIAGTVRFQGTPVGGAQIELHSMLSDVGRTTVARVTASATGQFDLGIHAPAYYEIVATAPGKTSAYLAFDLADPTLEPPSHQLELNLRACVGSVSGLIVDAAGIPIPGARARARRAVAVADATGKYQLCLPMGRTDLEFGAEGYGTVVMAVDVLGEALRDVVLVPEASIRVHVVHADTGAAVPDAHVAAYPVEWGSDRAAIRTALTGPTGDAIVSGLVPGRYEVNGQATGLLSDASAEVLATVGEEAMVTVTVTPRARISGVVMDGDHPVAGARVYAVRQEPYVRSNPGLSQDDGTFVLEMVPLGSLSFLASPHELTSAVVLDVDQPREYRGVTLQVRTSGRIEGVVSRGGVPVEGAEVCCVRTRDTRTDRTLSDARGRYSFAGAPAGSYQIGATSAEVGAFKGSVDVTLADGEQRTVDLELDLAGEISGVVVDQAGVPVVGALVTWTDDAKLDTTRCMSDAHGRYRCARLSGGREYRAAVYARVGTSTPYPTATGDPYPVRSLENGAARVTDVRIEISRSRMSLAGHVVDAAGGAVADAIVKIEPAVAGQAPRFPSWERAQATSTDEDGAFRFDGLAPGRLAVRARGPDGAEATLPAIEAGVAGVMLRLDPAGQVEGTLAGFMTPPLVFARRLDGDEFTTGSVDAAAFRIVGLRPGTYLVSAQSSIEGDARRVQVEPAAVARVTLTSRGTAAVVARIKQFSTENPVAGVACRGVVTIDGQRAMATWDPATAARSGADGMVRLARVPAGSTAIVCTVPGAGWSPPSVDLDLAPGSETNVELLTARRDPGRRDSFGLEFDPAISSPRVTRVVENSAAAAAGLAAGDEVTAVNGEPIKGLNGLGVWNLIDSAPRGSEVVVDYVRGGKAGTATGTLGPSGT